MLKIPRPNGRTGWAIRHRVDGGMTGKWGRDGMEGGDENEIARRCTRGGLFNAWQPIGRVMGEWLGRPLPQSRSPWTRLLAERV